MTDERTEATGAVKESPQLPEAPKEAQAEASPEDQAKALLGELTRLGVKKPDDLLNMAQASSQLGRTQNLLGEANRKIAELQTQIQALSAMSQKSQSKQSIDDSEGHSIDLRHSSSRKAIRHRRKRCRKPCNI